MIKKLIIFASLIFFYSCSSEKSENLEKELVTIPMELEFNESFDFIQDTTFIPLQFCDDCIIGDISKIIKTEDGFVISDKNISKQVFKFNKEGEFEFKIGSPGDGLGNYVLPFDISLVPNSDRVAVLDQNQQKIVFYSLKDGVFIEELPINFRPKSFQFISPAKVAIHFDGQFSGNEKDSLAGILDIQKEEFDYMGLIDYSKTDQNVTAGDFYSTLESLLFSKSLNDTVYQVDASGFTPKYYIDFGEKRVSDDIKRLAGTEMLMQLMKEVPYYHNGNFIENEAYLFFLWWGEDEFENFAVWDKNNEVVMRYNGKNLIFKRPFYVTNDHIYSFLTNQDYENLDNDEPFFGLSQNQVIIKMGLKNTD